MPETEEPATDRRKLEGLENASVAIEGDRAQFAVAMDRQDVRPDDKMFLRASVDALPEILDTCVGACHHAPFLSAVNVIVEADQSH
jgi:hypothetical protein